MAYLRIARIGAPRSNPTPARIRTSEKIRCAYIAQAPRGPHDDEPDAPTNARYILRDAAGPRAPSVTYIKHRHAVHEPK